MLLEKNKFTIFRYIGISYQIVKKLAAGGGGTIFVE